MSLKRVAIPTIFITVVLVESSKIPESRNLKRKANIICHQSISQIGLNGFKLIYEVQITFFLISIVYNFANITQNGFFWNGQINMK